jgi:glycosyltransferase involved in cell wall biosynthesis
MMDAALPRISIITPSLNQARFLEETIASVLSQGYPNLEYFIIDGGSTDGSVEIIRRYEEKLTGWVSEPDQGQSDAIIKGFARAGGDIMNWINSDDALMPGALRFVAKAFMASRADLIVGGDVHYKDSLATPVGQFRPSGYAYPDCLRFWNGRFRYHQPCTFFRRETYEKAGGLNKALHYVMDYDLYCRMLRLPGSRVVYIPAVLSKFRLHEAAKTATQKRAFLEEQRAVSQAHWTNAGFVRAAEAAAMDAYTAECLFHQASDELRRGRFGAARRSAAAGLRARPFHFLRYAVRRIFAGRQGRR